MERQRPGISGVMYILPMLYVMKDGDLANACIPHVVQHRTSEM